MTGMLGTRDFFTALFYGKFVAKPPCFMANLSLKYPFVDQIWNKNTLFSDWAKKKCICILDLGKIIPCFMANYEMLPSFMANSEILHPVLWEILKFYTLLYGKFLKKNPCNRRFCGYEPSLSFLRELENITHKSSTFDQHVVYFQLQSLYMRCDQLPEQSAQRTRT